MELQKATTEELKRIARSLDEAIYEEGCYGLGDMRLLLSINHELQKRAKTTNKKPSKNLDKN